MKTVLKEILIRLIDASGNPRGIQDTAKDSAFNANVEENGVLQPITVAPMTDSGLYPLVFGGRRLAALLAAGRETVIAQVLDAAPPADEMLIAQLSENLHRADLHPWDFLMAIDTLRAAGWSGKRLAKRLGESETSVSRWLAVSANASPEIRERIKEGTLSLSAAHELCRIPLDAQQAALAGEPAATRLTRDALLRKIKASQRGARNGKVGAAIHRVSVSFGRAQSIILVGRGLTLDMAIQRLGELLARATRAHAEGADLAAFARALKLLPPASEGTPS